MPTGSVKLRLTMASPVASVCEQRSIARRAQRHRRPRAGRLCAVGSGGSATQAPLTRASQALAAGAQRGSAEQAHGGGRSRAPAAWRREPHIPTRKGAPTVSMCTAPNSGAGKCCTSCARSRSLTASAAAAARPCCTSPGNNAMVCTVCPRSYWPMATGRMVAPAGQEQGAGSRGGQGKCEASMRGGSGMAGRDGMRRRAWEGTSHSRGSGPGTRHTPPCWQHPHLAPAGSGAACRPSWRPGRSGAGCAGPKALYRRTAPRAPAAGMRAGTHPNSQRRPGRAAGSGSCGVSVEQMQTALLAEPSSIAPNRDQHPYMAGLGGHVGRRRYPVFKQRHRLAGAIIPGRIRQRCGCQCGDLHAKLEGSEQHMPNRSQLLSGSASASGGTAPCQRRHRRPAAWQPSRPLPSRCVAMLSLKPATRSRPAASAAQGPSAT